MPRLSRNQLLVLTVLEAGDERAGIEVAGDLPSLARSSVYAALAALQRDRLLDARWDHSDSHPRRMVRINAEGRRALEATRVALLGASVRARPAAGGAST